MKDFIMYFEAFWMLGLGVLGVLMVWWWADQEHDYRYMRPSQKTIWQSWGFVKANVYCLFHLDSFVCTGHRYYKKAWATSEEMVWVGCMNGEGEVTATFYGEFDEADLIESEDDDATQ